MKILNAIYAQHVGGVNQVFSDYAKVLSKSGHEVALLISANSNAVYQIEGVTKIFKLKNFSQVFDCLHLIWIVLTFRPDVIFCHSNRVSKWMKIVKFFTKAKSVGINHGVGFKGSLNCDYAISVNQQISNMVTQAGFAREKSFIVTNAVEIEVGYRAKKLSLEKFVIGAYGRIEKEKGFEVLLKAAEILAKKGYNFRLKIGGFEVPKSGYYWSDIESCAKSFDLLERCEFVGLVSDKKSFFADVDILCVPSYHESFGMVILEGFLHSTLVVSSDTDGGKILIKHKENGKMFRISPLSLLIKP